ncbi:MAG: hypothetical protein ACYTX0_62390, partial [Nostoc sp.]
SEKILYVYGLNDRQGIGNQADNLLILPSPNAKESDKWYTPPKIEDLVIKVLGTIDLDPCADDGKHIAAAHHYTAADDGLSQEWHGRIFMNP